jgi:alginate O-acetyltransferase complex protein AlgI
VTFPSLTFVIFFAVVLAASRSPLSWTARKGVLLVGSYVFYAVWNPPFVVLLWLSTAVDWTLARAIHRSEHDGKRRLLLLGSLAVNLGLLAFFKYAGFLMESFAVVADALGWRLTVEAPSLVLPVGISFYTFQTLSYTIDVYRRRLAPSDALLDYALYVTFFPQLVAGPIVRAGHFLPQAKAERRASADQVGWGLTLLSLGLFQKLALADGLLAPIGDRVFDVTRAAGEAAVAVSGGDAWVGAFAFAGQIFFDFSGYSTCAIGVALTLGFHLPDNFRAPYAAVGFSDFWRRWHISLSSWLRDYLYIPLGGNRYGIARTAVALFTTMLLGGLWHGASWTFVAWGALHGLYLVGERLLTSVVGAAAWTTATPTRLAAGLLTFALVCVAWVFFRAEGFEHALHIVQAMAGIAAGPSVLPRWQGVLVACVIGPLLLAHATLRHQTLETLAGKAPAGLRILALALCLLAVFVSPGNDRAFIYFQF